MTDEATSPSYNATDAEHLTHGIVGKHPNEQPQTDASTPTEPTAALKVFGTNTVPGNGLIGLNIALDDSSVCGPDGCL